MLHQSVIVPTVYWFLLQVRCVPDSPFPGNAWAQFMGQHGIALPTEKSGGGHLALDFFLEEKRVLLCGCKLYYAACPQGERTAHNPSYLAAQV